MRRFGGLSRGLPKASIHEDIPGRTGAALPVPGIQKILSSYKKVFEGHGAAAGKRASRIPRNGGVEGTFGHQAGESRNWRVRSTSLHMMPCRASSTIWRAARWRHRGSSNAQRPRQRLAKLSGRAVLPGRNGDFEIQIWPLFSPKFRCVSKLGLCDTHPSSTFPLYITAMKIVKTWKDQINQEQLERHYHKRNSFQHKPRRLGAAALADAGFE